MANMTFVNLPFVLGLISMISDIRVVCPLLVQAKSQPNIAFYLVTQTQTHGNLSLADVDSDIQAILGNFDDSLMIAFTIIKCLTP